LSIVRDLREVKEIYAEAAHRRWVLPCICSENLTTTEAIFEAAAEFEKRKGIRNVPIIIAITCNYGHRSQAANYTCTKRWDTGLALFTNDIKILAGPGGPYEDLRIMIHLDHIQYDSDLALLQGDLSDYASIMYDASALPFEENIAKTAEFVARRGGEILIEGACDEIVDATGGVHNDPTTPEKAERYVARTGVNLVVANLGTEHRASSKELKYHGDVAKRIKEKIGTKIVLHGTSSVTNNQVEGLFGDGVCKVNIWTALERDSSPALFQDMVRDAVKVAGSECVERLIGEGLLTRKCCTGGKAAISHFTTLHRQQIVFEEMKKIVSSYLDMWYI
jgi:fructose/tagatose bisphosphate aldolase